MRPGVVSIAIVAAGIVNTTLTADTFTAAVATGWSDPVTGDPDFADLSIFGVGATVFSPFSPSTGTGQTNLFNPFTGGPSSFQVGADMTQDGDMYEVTINWSTSDGSSFFENIASAAMMLPSGRTANILWFDIGNRTGAGGIPADGIDLGTEWAFVSGTQTLTDTMGGSSTSEITFGDSPFPYPDPTSFYATSNFLIDSLDSQNLNGISYTFNLQAVPTPGALALLGVAGLSRRRRRD